MSTTNKFFALENFPSKFGEDSKFFKRPSIHILPYRSSFNIIRFMRCECKDCGDYV